MARGPHFAPKAKRVIHLFMNGGPAHMDTFDPKPELSRWSGKALPEGRRLGTERKTGAAFGSPFSFRRHGQSGLPVSEIFPHVARHVDDLAARPLDVLAAQLVDEISAYARQRVRRYAVTAVSAW